MTAVAESRVIAAAKRLHRNRREFQRLTAEITAIECTRFEGKSEDEIIADPDGGTPCVHRKVDDEDGEGPPHVPWYHNWRGSAFGVGRHMEAASIGAVHGYCASCVKKIDLLRARRMLKRSRGGIIAGILRCVDSLEKASVKA